MLHFITISSRSDTWGFLIQETFMLIIYIDYTQLIKICIYFPGATYSHVHIKENLIAFLAQVYLLHHNK